MPRILAVTLRTRTVAQAKGLGNHLGYAHKPPIQLMKREQKKVLPIDRLHVEV